MGMYTHWHAHTNMHICTQLHGFIYVCVHTYTYSHINASTCAHDVPTWCDIREYTSRCRHTCVYASTQACTPSMLMCAYLCTMHVHKRTCSHRHKNVRACVDTPARVYIHPHTCIRAHARTHVHTALVLLSRLQWPGLGRTPMS